LYLEHRFIGIIDCHPSKFTSLSSQLFHSFLAEFVCTAQIQSFSSIPQIEQQDFGFISHDSSKNDKSCSRIHRPECTKCIICCNSSAFSRRSCSIRALTPSTDI